MSIRAITIFTFLMMTLLASMEAHACGEMLGKIADADKVQASSMSGLNSASAKYCSDCPDMEAAEFCDHCAMTCMSFSSALETSVHLPSTMVPPDSKINQGLSTQILNPHKFRVLRPPIS